MRFKFILSIDKEFNKIFILAKEMNNLMNVEPCMPRVA